MIRAFSSPHGEPGGGVRGELRLRDATADGSEIRHAPCAELLHRERFVPDAIAAMRRAASRRREPGAMALRARTT